MNSPRLGLRVASFTFGLVTAAQAARLMIRPDVLVNGWEMPLWPSAIAVVLFGGLCIWMSKLAGSLGKQDGTSDYRQ